MEKEITKAPRRSKVGRVISNKTAKTIKVEIEGIHQHPKYKKYIKQVSTFLVHDPEQKCQIGDIIRIEESRHVSKLKNWVVREILEHANKSKIDELKEKSDDSSGNNA